MSELEKANFNSIIEKFKVDMMEGAEKCPYCGESYTNVKKHMMRYCDKRPMKKVTRVRGLWGRWKI